MSRMLLMVLVVFCCCAMAHLPCPAQLAQQESFESGRDAVIDWARGQAVALETFEPGADTSDLVGVRQLIGDARVVLLGDSRHDAREQWLLKHRLIEYLAAEMGFSVLAMEESLPCTFPLNAFLRGERDDVAVPLSEMGSWYLWETEELMALMSALRSHNDAIESGRVVRVFGFDISDGARPGVRNALSFLALADQDSAEELRGAIDLSPFSESFWVESFQNYGAMAPEAADSLGRSLARLREALIERKDILVEKRGLLEYEWALRQVVVAQQAHEMFVSGIRDSYEDAGAVRERAMTDNLSWLLRVAAPDEKVIVWAHNFHVARTRQDLDIPGRPAASMTPLGCLLAEEFGDSMVSIGFAFEHGAASTELEPSPEDWFDGVLADVGPDIMLLDLRSAPEDGPVHEWLHAEQVMRDQGGRAVLVPARAFDAIAFVRTVGFTTRTAGAASRLAPPDGQ